MKSVITKWSCHEYNNVIMCRLLHTSDCCQSNTTLGDEINLERHIFTIILSLGLRIGLRVVCGSSIISASFCPCEKPHRRCNAYCRERWCHQSLPAEEQQDDDFLMLKNWMLRLARRHERRWGIYLIHPNACQCLHRVDVPLSTNV